MGVNLGLKVAEYYTIFGPSRAEYTCRKVGVNHFQNFLFSWDISVVMELRPRALPPRNRISGFRFPATGVDFRLLRLFRIISEDHLALFLSFTSA